MTCPKPHSWLSGSPGLGIFFVPETMGVGKTGTLHEDTESPRQTGDPPVKGQKARNTSPGLIFLKLNPGEGVGTCELAGERGENCGADREVEGGSGGRGLKCRSPLLASQSDGELTSLLLHRPPPWLGEQSPPQGREGSSQGRQSPCKK